MENKRPRKITRNPAFAGLTCFQPTILFLNLTFCISDEFQTLFFRGCSLGSMAYVNGNVVRMNVRDILAGRRRKMNLRMMATKCFQCVFEREGKSKSRHAESSYLNLENPCRKREHGKFWE